MGRVELKTRVSQVLGFSRIILNLMWIVVGVLGIIYGVKGFGYVEVSIMNNLSIADSNIEILRNLLAESIDIVETIDQSIATIEQSSIDASLGLIDTRPMITKTSQVVTQDIPLALDEVQTSMPNVIRAASMIDQTLYILSMFRFGLPNPFGEDIEISLGVDYDPEISLEDSLARVFGNLEGIPERMRSLESDLNMADMNLNTLGENLINAAYDLDLIRAQVADIIPGIEQLIANLETLQTGLQHTSDQLQQRIDVVQNFFIGLMILVILSQVPSMYIGYLLTNGYSKKNDENGERKN
ncbi:hypothetical protein AMJ86_01905 [bacterium SM23_57]|nr:MAG: hypothetical protein AMJ86_01905 [bacterium SM23_57]